MKIGIDLHALQAPSCRGRGIGRYASSLLRALLIEAPAWEFVFYRRTDLELSWDADLDHRVTQWVDLSPDDRDDPDGTLQHVVNRNPHDLDWLLIANPVVERRGFALPEPVPGGPRLAAIVYDFIPALFPHHYLRGPKIAEEYARDLTRLRSYDLLLAISEATRRDTIDHLGVPEQRTANLSAAVDRAFFRPAENSEDDRRILSALGISGSYYYYLGNVDWRKNILGLVDAYALVPPAIRATHPLVLTFGENDWFRRVLAEKVAALGLESCVISTGSIDDLTTRALYRGCTLFLSPSLYEGFGLPILEAMSCGAAVVVANNSSQPEVAGSAGAIVKTSASEEWADVITRLVNEPARIAEMRAASVSQAERFSWQDSAKRLKAAIERAPAREKRTRHTMIVAHASDGSLGFDDESSRLFHELCRKPGAIAILDIERADSLPPIPTTTPWHDSRVFQRVNDALGQPPIVHVIDLLDDLRDLITELEARPATVVFANPGADAPWMDGDLHEILRRATEVRCRSERLVARLKTLGGSDTRVRWIDAPLRLVS